MRNQAIRTLLLMLLLVCFTACAGDKANQPTPEAAKRFLKLRGYEFDEKSFFKAAEAGDAIAVNGFLSAGINVNAKDENDDTALTAAAARGDSQIIGVLLKRGADVNAKGRNNWTALLLALEDERFEVAEILVGQSNLDLKAENPTGMTALMLAVWHKRPEFVKRMLQRGADPNHQDKDGDAALHGAAWFGEARI